MGRAKGVVAALVLALAVYVVVIGWRGWALLHEPKWGLKILGVAVFVLPLIGLYLVWTEVRFGLATERLGQALVDEGADPEPDLPLTPSGRPERGAADALFDQRRRDVEAAPGDWRNWYRLALAYDYAGDRRRARESMRTAIGKCESERRARRPSA